CRQENAISSRLGRHLITQSGGLNTPLADLNVHTLARLKGLTTNYRYAVAGPHLYRLVGDADGSYSSLAVPGGSFSGERVSWATYRPTNSSFPYNFFADALQMVKDNGTFAPLQQWGIFAPTIPPTVQVLNYNTNIVDDFSGAVGTFTFSNITGTA